MSDMDNSQNHILSRDQTSLVVRLVRSAFLWAVPFILIAAMVILWVYRSSTFALFDDPLDATVTSLIASADSELGNEQSTQIISLAREPLDPRYQRALSGRYWLIGQIYRDGRIVPLRSSRSMAGETLAITANNANLLFEQPGVTLRARTIGPDKEPLRFAARPCCVGPAAWGHRLRSGQTGSSTSSLPHSRGEIDRGSVCTSFDSFLAPKPSGDPFNGLCRSGFDDHSAFCG
jgi:hypothetical protein